MDDERMEVPRHYEPPGLRTMMEILKLLGHHGKITMTITLSTGNSEADADA